MGAGEGGPARGDPPTRFAHAPAIPTTMLVYTKTFPAPLTLVLRWYGAATGRAAPYALVCAAATLALHVAVPARVRDRYEEGWLHPYPFQTFAYVAGFAIVFRNNYAYQRYLSAREGLQQMGSKFADLTSQAMAFDLVQDVPDAGEVRSVGRRP